MLREAIQDLNRLRQILTIAARHGFLAYLDQSRLGELLGKREAEDLRAAASGTAPASAAGGRRLAQRFRQMLIELGPTFIKLGQLLSTRADLLPAPWVEELSELQDAVPPITLDEVRAQIESGLGRKVEDCFASLEPVPLASASIGQVHRAVTHAGEQVVVKVQRPRIRQRMEADLGLLYQVARVVEAVVEETGVSTPTGLVEEFDRALHEELDFRHEAANARAMAEASKDRAFLVIPKVFDELSSGEVLTLEYVEGVKVTEVRGREGFDPKQVAKNVVETAFRQVFVDGLFHGDPHPGNLLVLPGDRVALLDFGLVGRLTRTMQEALVTILMATALRDADSMARVLNRVGVPEEHTPVTAFRADIAEILDRYLGVALGEIRASSLLRDLLDLAVKHRIRVPKEYAVLSRASITVEGIVRQLDPDLDIAEVGLPYAKELLLSRFSASDASSALMKSLLKIQTLAEDVPAQLHQILVDLEGGKFRVNVHSELFVRLDRDVRRVGLALVLALFSTGLTLGGIFTLDRVLAAGGGGPTFLALAALGSGALLFLASVGMFLFGGPRRKLSIRRLLDR